MVVRVIIGSILAAHLHGSDSEDRTDPTICVESGYGVGCCFEYHIGCSCRIVEGIPQGQTRIGTISYHIDPGGYHGSGERSRAVHAGCRVVDGHIVGTVDRHRGIRLVLQVEYVLEHGSMRGADVR